MDASEQKRFRRGIDLRRGAASGTHVVATSMARLALPSAEIDRRLIFITVTNNDNDIKGGIRCRPA